VSRMRRVLNHILTIPENPRWYVPLIVVNLGGALYGFSWYAQQLAASPPVLWPVIPDSPLAVLSFGILLLSLRAGRPWPLLLAYALLSSAKYGLWTVFVIGQHFFVGRVYDFENVHLILSHGGMFVQALLFARYWRPGRVYVLLGGAWFLFNDFMDYVVGTHPTLPSPELLPYVAAFSVVTTLAFTMSLFIAGPSGGVPDD